jgi:hypothetical protein
MKHDLLTSSTSLRDAARVAQSVHDRNSPFMIDSDRYLIMDSLIVDHGSKINDQGSEGDRGSVTGGAVAAARARRPAQRAPGLANLDFFETFCKNVEL